MYINFHFSVGFSLNDERSRPYKSAEKIKKTVRWLTKAFSEKLRLVRLKIDRKQQKLKNLQKALSNQKEMERLEKMLNDLKSQYGFLDDVMFRLGLRECRSIKMWPFCCLVNIDHLRIMTSIERLQREAAGPKTINELEDEEFKLRQEVIELKLEREWYCDTGEDLETIQNISNEIIERLRDINLLRKTVLCLCLDDMKEIANIFERIHGDSSEVQTFRKEIKELEENISNSPQSIRKFYQNLKKKLRKSYNRISFFKL